MQTSGPFNRINEVLSQRVNQFGQFGLLVGSVVLMNDVFLSKFVDH